MNNGHQPKKIKKPWPTKAAMEQVYEKKLWGGGEHDFYSGAGSHDAAIVEPYIEVVTSFLKSLDEPPVVVDLGCGDFNVGKALINHTKNYVAVDIVQELIDRNKEKFDTEKVEFLCLDIAQEDLSKGDVVIIRQVLQHLSNAEVLKVVAKLTNYKYVILTEHLPVGDFVPNKDIISGQGIRLKKRSGLDLLAPPFHMEVKEEKELLTVEPSGNKGVIVTTLYTVF